MQVTRLQLVYSYSIRLILIVRLPRSTERSCKLDQKTIATSELTAQVLLLSGPPGYGKTTLAHIVAQQAGYRTLEINASDDRSATTVTSRIKNAIDAGSGLGAEGRPTCVIIDEIDGASGGGDAVSQDLENNEFEFERFRARCEQGDGG